MIKLNSYQKICVAIFILVAIFHTWIFAITLKEGFYNNVYSLLMGIIPAITGLIAIKKSHLWSGFRSAIGKAVFFVGLGLLGWGIGEMIWSYYNFFENISAPYPSLADIFFAPGIFFYSLGAFYFSGATGVKFGFKSGYAKLVVVLTSIAVMLMSYYLLVIVARHGIILSDKSNPIKVILDIFYPLEDFFGLLLAVITSGFSYRYLGGKYKYDIFAILLGIGVMFVGDTVFSYTTTVGTFYNGDFGDFIFTLGLFLLSFGVLGFCKLKNNPTDNVEL